jgi:ribosome-binding protein aMBF1 (putative translation factor)
MKKQKDLIDFDEVAARALKKPEVMAAFTKARAMRLAAEAVRKARERGKLSQADMARAMGKPQSLVARIESARANTTVETLYEIAAATGTELVISFKKPGSRAD